MSVKALADLADNKLIDWLIEVDLDRQWRSSFKPNLGLKGYWGLKSVCQGNSGIEWSGSGVEK
jgi:hypothetical protein